jgi:hypothetical protein
VAPASAETRVLMLMSSPGAKVTVELAVQVVAVTQAHELD